MPFVIDFSYAQDGAKIIFDSVVLEDPTDSYGIRIVGSTIPSIAAGTALTHDGGGDYSYNFAGSDDNTDYEYYVKATKDGVNTWVYGLIVGGEGTSTPVHVGRYTDTSCLYRKFGQVNVNVWAEVSSGDALASVNAMREAITEAENRIDNVLNNGPYVVPFTGDIPPLIRDIACKLSACNLYAAKGELDFSPTGSLDGRSQTMQSPMNKLHWHRDEALAMLADIRKGRIRIKDSLGVDLAGAATYPIVVTD